ncbi:probable alpha-ketoglutarate-dependent hypophosphite dioxygenase [Panulirus ornatus]|uniref:probable alpha-ketoglutarate-dependent hypophosphite dioxygenase n=1 Tax=Panulirus ornatus TaxID=150431 RepID=UPI003A8A50E7
MMKVLTEEQKELYKSQGYLVLDLLTESQLEELTSAYNDVFSHHNTEGTWGGQWRGQDTTTTEVFTVHGLQLHSAVFTRLLLHEPLLDVCEDIMATYNILLHHTKAHWKPPNHGSAFPMHQDYHYFPYKNHSPIAVFISLDDAGPANGGLCVYPGTHKLGPQPDCSTETTWHYLDPQQFPLEKATPLTLKKGQVVIFSYLLIHGSYVNTSSSARRMFLMQLTAADDQPASDEEPRPCQTMVLRGQTSLVSRDVFLPPQLRHKEPSEDRP